MDTLSRNLVDRATLIIRSRVKTRLYRGLERVDIVGKYRRAYDTFCCFSDPSSNLFPIPPDQLPGGFDSNMLERIEDYLVHDVSRILARI